MVRTVKPFLQALSTVKAGYESVNEWQGRVLPSSERRGGCAIKKMLRSLLMKAQTGWSVPDNVSTSTFTMMTTPSAALRRFRTFFLLARPPLLDQGEEYSFLDSSSSLVMSDWTFVISNFGKHP